MKRVPQLHIIITIFFLLFWSHPDTEYKLLLQGTASGLELETQPPP